MIRRLGALGAAALLLLAAACSGDDSDSSGTPTSASSGATTAPGATDATTVPGGPTDTTGGTTSPEPTGTDDTLPDTIVDDTAVVVDSAPEDDVVDTEPPAQLALPTDGPTTVGDVELPAGHVLADGEQRLAWITDDVVADAAAVWLRLYDAYEQTGLYPVLVYDDGSEAGWESEAFFPNQPFELDNFTLEDVLTNSAELNFDPPRTFEGLAPASSGPQDLDAADAAVAAMADARILLTESPRGADALSYMGWTGNATFDSTEAICTAIRSWEERYGARVVAIGPTRLTLSISRPPATADEAAALSEELVLLDPVLETGEAPGEIGVVELGDGLLGQHTWTLWWL